MQRSRIINRVLSRRQQEAEYHQDTILGPEWVLFNTDFRASFNRHIDIRFSV